MVEITKESLEKNFNKEINITEQDEINNFNVKVQKIINEVTNEIIKANAEGKKEVKLKIGYIREVAGSHVMYKYHIDERIAKQYKTIKHTCTHHLNGSRCSYDISHLYTLVREFNKVGINCSLRKVKYAYECRYSTTFASKFLFVGFFLDFNW